MIALPYIAALVAALADLWITSRNLKTGTEHNPVLRWLFGKLGVWPGGLALKAATGAAAAGLSFVATGTPAYGLWGHAGASLIGFVISFKNRAR
jgi:hypothetical protein